MTTTAAVIGTGFIGTVHIGALRRLGIPVAGVLGSSPDRAAARGAALGLPAYASLDALLADPAVTVVHVTSPNDLHYPQVKAILAAGKHVICEKPLAMTAAQSAEMVALAQASGKVAAVCYNIRFYPLNQHARGLVASGALGDIRLITGHYHQDWLAKETDWNWRLVPSAGGTLRSVGDIGTHWLDLVTFIAGERPTHVLADLQTVIPTRQRPTGPVETFTAAAGPTVPEVIQTDDTAQMLLRFASGARAVFTTSQVSHGRKNSLRWDITASNGSAAWDSETPDHLWLGHRDAPNQILQRDASLMHPLGGQATSLPPGHVEGFADSFHSFFRAVYPDIAKGGRSPDATWATFEDGHAEMAFCDAVIHSAQTQSWTAI
jgi:predicted dehydrogenase